MNVNDIYTITHRYKHPGVIIGNSNAVFNIGVHMHSLSQNDLLNLRQLIVQRICDCPRVTLQLNGHDQYTRSWGKIVLDNISQDCLKTVDDIKQILVVEHSNHTIENIITNFIS